MSKRQYQQQAAQHAIVATEGALPTQRPIAVYYRQSTDAQIGNVSTSIQTVDMVAYLKQRGWAEDHILMIDMDAGVSGTTRIDERPGMRQLFHMITEGTIGAVACQDEDRLFRDVTQIQVNIFIEACKQSDVCVLTPSMVYNFAHETIGAYHARQFRFKSEMAAEYITSYIRGRLHPAKRRVMLEGRWAGGSIPPGYTIDNRKKLATGAANPDWRKYVPYQPYAEVIQAYFRLFIALAGNLTATFHHIQEHGPYYPDPKQQIAPEGFRFLPPKPIRNYGGHGYCPGKGALRYLLTNVAYIGHFTVNDTIIAYNNHPALLPLDVFLRAYNYLSAVNFDGSPNVQYTPHQHACRPTVEAKRTTARPLCVGLLGSEIEGGFRKAGTNYNSPYQHYCYIVTEHYPYERPIWSRKADFIDAAVMKLLQEKLVLTFQVDAWQEKLEKVAQDITLRKTAKMKQLSILERTMENLMNSLAALSHAQMIQKVQEQYIAAENEHRRLSRDIAEDENEAARYDALNRLQTAHQDTFTHWETFTADEQRVILHSFIETIIATPLPNHGIHLRIHWKNNTMDELSLATVGKTYTHWLDTEVERLLLLVKQDAPQVALCQAFPHRTWKAIRDKVRHELGRGNISVTSQPIQEAETYLMYLERTADSTSLHRANGGEKWKAKDIAHLRSMLEAEATQLELCQAFSQRTWAGIRTKIKALDETYPEVKGIGEVQQHETFAEYEARKAQENGEYKGDAPRVSPGSERSSMIILPQREHFADIPTGFAP